MLNVHRKSFCLTVRCNITDLGLFLLKSYTYLTDSLTRPINDQFVGTVFKFWFSYN